MFLKFNHHYFFNNFLQKEQSGDRVEIIKNWLDFGKIFFQEVVVNHLI